MNIKKETLKLQKNRLLKNTNEINNFETAIENIIALKDVKIINNLCSGFDDKTEGHEVMFGLVHAIESFDGEDGLLEMVNAIPRMLPHAKEWVTILNYRILNHEPSRKLYIKVLSNIDNSIKNIVIQILKEIRQEDSVRFEKPVNEILSSV